MITEWALQSYVELKHRRVFTKQEYQTTLRPDAKLLKDGFPSPHAKFQNGKFWGPATDLRNNILKDGYKMKWHNIGSGKVQLRLAVAILNGVAYLCRAYVKTNENVDRREMARFKIHIQDISTGHYFYRGQL